MNDASPDALASEPVLILTVDDLALMLACEELQGVCHHELGVEPPSIAGAMKDVFDYRARARKLMDELRGA